MTVLNVTIFCILTLLMVSFSDCDICFALSYSNLYVIIFLQLLCNSREMRDFDEHNIITLVRLSPAIGTFLINDIQL